MMNRPYSRELSADTSAILIPAITGFVFFICLIIATIELNIQENWHYWVVLILFPISSYISWLLIQKDRVESANLLFIITGSLLLTLFISQEWSPTSGLPYVYSVFILIASMTMQPQVSFWVWGGTAVLMSAAVGVNQTPFSFSYLYNLLSPILINFFLALVAYLAAYEWRFAVESISDLHRKVRSRRNELFAVQEELALNNSILRSLNDEIAKARNQAVEEKEIRTRFMNTVSHELRMPLNSIVNFAHILTQGVRGPVNEGQIDYLTRIQQSGWHLLAVLNDLLDMAQIEAGEFDMRLMPTDLQIVCEEALNNIIGLQVETNISIIRDYPEVWPMVQADPMRLRQAIINLLGNAFKYTQKGYICLRVCSDENWIYISVEDTGIGIAAENMDDIFKEFHQINQDVARRRVGTGLGLPITKHLVERHGGKILVESEPDKGSKFVICLPNKEVL